MLVKATQIGYYGVVLREVGHIFKLTDPKHFTDVWMEKVESFKGNKGSKSSSKNEPVGNRPPPEDEDAVVARIAAADKMAEEAASEGEGEDVI